jgi:hypothetical protein
VAVKAVSLMCKVLGSNGGVVRTEAGERNIAQEPMRALPCWKHGKFRRCKATDSPHAQLRVLQGAKALPSLEWLKHG